MVLKYSFRGFMAPVFTPFTESQEINYKLILPYAQYLKNHGVNGVLVNGTTGEGVSLNVNERKQVTEEWVKVTKNTKQSVMVQVGGAPLPDVIDLAKHAEELKADSLLCLPELFFKPKKIEDLIDYLKIISKVAPKTPLLYYHIPFLTDVNLDMEDFVKAACLEISTFAGIKYTHINLDEGTRALKAGNKYDIAVFLGAEQLLSPATVLGFDSAVATTLNLWPQLLFNVQSNVRNGKIQEAKDDQDELTRRITEITKHGSWVATMKAAMNLFSGMDMGKPRPPLKPLTELQIRNIASAISS